MQVSYLIKYLEQKAIAPPTNLNQENARIWAGWNELGDKEVAREASAKGFYVDLAINFIAARRKLDFSEAHVWFKEEVSLKKLSTLTSLLLEMGLLLLGEIEACTKDLSFMYKFVATYCQKSKFRANFCINNCLFGHLFWVPESPIPNYIGVAGVQMGFRTSVSKANI